MTSTIERPVPRFEPPDRGDQAEAVSAPKRGRHERATGPAARTPAHWLLATLVAAAGVIHLVMAPVHFGASTADGVAFLAAGWAQVCLAALVAARPHTAVFALAAAANAVFVGAWLMAHSVGLPYGAHRGAAETATFVSQVCVVLEVAAVVLAVVLAFQPRLGAGHRRAGLVLAGVAAVAVLAATTAAIASPSARGGGHADAGAASAAGGTHGAPGHHGAAGGDPSATSKVVDDRGYAVLGNGHEHDEPEGYGEPLDDTTEMQLRQQLAHAYQLQAQYPTVADAEAAGYERSGPFAPGLGAHYGLGGGIGGLAADGPEGAPEVGAPMLIYDGTEPDSPIAGFMYMARSFTEEPAEGFAGPDDVWHYHSDVCVAFGPEGLTAPLGADRSTTQEQCDQFDGFLIPKTNYMVHVWSVPGYESSDGLFSNLNPAIRCPDGSYYSDPDSGTAPTTCLT